MATTYFLTQLTNINKVSADYIDTSESVLKTVTDSEKNTWNSMQPATDNNLTTTTKTVVGAINEHENDINSMSEDITLIYNSKANLTDFISHTENTSNPHSVTKSQVGLENVPNVSTNDQTPIYSVASTLAALVSGEALSMAFSKIAKAISDLISHIANKSNPHGVTISLIGAAASSHTHSYAGSSSAGGSATSAVKLDTSTSGSATLPCYFTGGKPTACTAYSSASVNYANSAGSSSTAGALTTSAGSSTTPIYFSSGKPVSCSYSLNKTVPSDAKFTDTNTWRGIQNNLTSTSTTDSLSAYQGKLLNTNKVGVSDVYRESTITISYGPMSKDEDVWLNASIGTMSGYTPLLCRTDGGSAYWASVYITNYNFNTAGSIALRMYNASGTTTISFTQYFRIIWFRTS